MNSGEFLQAGSFNVRLSVEAPVTVDDGCGGTTNSWEHRFDVCVRLVPVRGVLVERARNETSQITHWLFLRCHPDLKREMRFVSGTGPNSRTFEIDTVFDPDETGRYLQCEVREIE